MQVSADTSKKRINSLSMELIEARNKLDAKDKVKRFVIYLFRLFVFRKMSNILLD